MSPAISDAEWEIMKALWQKSPLTSQEIIAAVARANGWQPETVKTLVGRLVKKKAVVFSQEGRCRRYRPAVAREECARAEGRSFLKRVYDGALTPMIASFIRDAKLGPGEIGELRRILDGREDQHGKRG